MLVAHLSDLHLGYRAYDREEGGRNVREQDVEGAFERSLSRLVDLRPGLLIISGDVFDRPDPPSSAVVALAKGLERLRTELAGVPVVMIAGSSDTPLRAGGEGALAAFDTIPGIEAAHDVTRTVRVTNGSVSVTLVPHRALLGKELSGIRPDPAATWNILVLRARVRASRVSVGASTDAHHELLPLDPNGWDYVALGYRHTHHTVAPRVAYAGALERIGPDPWREAASEKGFLTIDLPSGEVRFVPIPGRPVVELARIRIRPGDPEHTARRIREVVRETPGGITGKIVRMRLEGLPGGTPPRLDEALLEDLRQRALHLSVRVDWPLVAGSGADLAQRLSNEANTGLGPEVQRLLQVGQHEVAP